MNEKNFIYNSQFSFLIPKDFIIVKEDIIDFLSNYLKDEQKKEKNNLIFDIIIGGKYIIIKDKNNDNSVFIYLYNKQREMNYNMNSILL